MTKAEGEPNPNFIPSNVQLPLTSIDRDELLAKREKRTKQDKTETEIGEIATAEQLFDPGPEIPKQPEDVDAYDAELREISERAKRHTRPPRNRRRSGAGADEPPPHIPDARRLRNP